MKPTSSICWTSRRSMVVVGERVAVFTAEILSQVERQKREDSPDHLARKIVVLIEFEAVRAGGVVDEGVRQIARYGFRDHAIERVVEAGKPFLSRAKEEDRDA